MQLFKIFKYLFNCDQPDDWDALRREPQAAALTWHWTQCCAVCVCLPLPLPWPPHGCCHRRQSRPWHQTAL